MLTFSVSVAERRGSHVTQAQRALAAAVHKQVAVVRVELCCCYHLCQILHVCWFDVHNIWEQVEDWTLGKEAAFWWDHFCFPDFRIIHKALQLTLIWKCRPLLPLFYLQQSLRGSEYVLLGKLFTLFFHQCFFDFLGQLLFEWEVTEHFTYTHTQPQTHTLTGCRTL